MVVDTAYRKRKASSGAELGALSTCHVPKPQGTRPESDISYSYDLVDDALVLRSQIQSASELQHDRCTRAHIHTPVTRVSLEHMLGSTCIPRILKN